MYPHSINNLEDTTKGEIENIYKLSTERFVCKYSLSGQSTVVANSTGPTNNALTPSYIFPRLTATSLN